MESAPKENPYELISWKQMDVPRILFLEGKEKELDEYTKGWEAQKMPREQIAHGTADSWYDTGATKCWTKYQYMTEGGEVREMELDHLMKAMRDNTHRIPVDAWPDEDYGSDRSEFAGQDEMKDLI